MSSKTKRKSTLINKKTPRTPKFDKSKTKSKTKSKNSSSKVIKLTKTKNLTPTKNTKSENKPKRKTNMSETRSEREGLNISVSRVKNIIDNILNKDCNKAITEVKNAYKPTKKDDSGNVIELPSVSVKKLSQETLDLIEYSKRFYDRNDKEEYEKEYLNGLSDEKKEEYEESRRIFLDKFNERMNKVPEFGQEKFDEDEFNKSFDSKFYSGFTDSPSKKNEWESATEIISKMKVRFSSNARVIIGGFFELLIRQLSINGIYNCKKSGKKIIKLHHALKIEEGVEEYFPLLPIMLNTKTYRDAVQSLNSEEKSVQLTDKPKDPNNILKYVDEICRDVRMKLYSNQISISGDSIEKESYKNASVSREFKVFCDSLIFEISEIMGRMIRTEINARKVKTLSNTITKTVIEHIHTVNGIDFTESLGFIEDSKSKNIEYNKNKKKNSDESE